MGLNRVQIKAKTTLSAAANGASVAVDNTVIPAGTTWTLVLKIDSLTDQGQVRFQFTDSVNAFTASLAGPSFSAAGAIGPTFDKRWTVKQYDFPDLRIGASNAVIRLDLVAISGPSPSVTFEAWIEY